MPHDVTMPQLGMTQDAGKIVTWFKAAGDAVARGDALFEVETDKATMEVEAQTDGFLTNVSASEGEDVPVGAVIARISESAEDDGNAAPAPAPQNAASEPATDASALPKGKPVTMPQLGMTQDTGLLVRWTKSLGDAVARGDILFEVETDKSTVEVEADTDGYLAATLAHAGEEVAVGHAVAIISADKQDAPVARGIAETTPEPAVAPATPSPPPEKAPNPQLRTESGRILASPKARRIALQQGLDLSRLVAAGHPQPFHVRDLETLRALSADPETQTQAPLSAQHFVAQIATVGMPAFAAWAAETYDLTDADAILATLAAASLPRDAAVTVAVHRHGTTKTYGVPEGRRLSATTSSDEQPDLILRDLRDTAVRTVRAGAGAAPILTLTTQDAGVSITLECSAAQLDADSAITLLSSFAGRMEQPLRHLL